MRLAIVAGLPLWAGATLLLSKLRWFSRPALIARLRAYSPGGLDATDYGGPWSLESFREVVGPLCRRFGQKLARLFGVNEELEVRLARVHSGLDATGFRVRQVGWSLASLGAATLTVVALSPPGGLLILVLAGSPLLGFLVVEQQLASASSRRQRRLLLELPVFSEQLAMLLSAGFSLGSALNRLADRGQGACAEDLRRACSRIRQGLTEVDALAEWAEVAQVEALDRLVPVLALNRDASDLGRLISEEARAIRRDVQRQLVQTMERRSQQVWVPVTVATLVPGVIFMAIPFIEALRLFSGS